MSEKAEKGKLFSRKNILIALGALLALAVACLAFGFYLNSTPEGQATNTAEAIGRATEDAKPTKTQSPTTEPTQKPSPVGCEVASRQQFIYVDEGMDGDNYIKEAYSVRSNDYEKVFFVSAWIYGPGMENGAGPGVWAITGEKKDPGIILAVDGFADEFTPYPLGSTTAANVTLADHGAAEAKLCAELHK